MESVKKQGRKRRREAEAQEEHAQEEASAQLQTHDNEGDSDDGSGAAAEQLYAATALSLTNSPIKLDDPSIPPHLARFRALTRLDLTATGINSTAFLERAIAISRKSAAAEHDSEYFGQRITFLTLTDNPLLGSAASSSSSSSNPWSGLELLTALFVLHLTRCSLDTLPPLASLPNLRALILSHNEITALPASFPPMPHLNTLVLSHNKLTALPPTLPSSCPNLSKLSLTFNDLSAASLPDFTNVLSLREVRLGNNLKLGKLPAHISSWGRGTDGTGKGLSVLEIKNCGLYTFDQLSALLVNPSPPSQKGGLGVLNLKGNGVCEEDGYREKILSIHQHLRVLDEVRIEQDGAHGSKARGSSGNDKQKAKQRMQRVDEHVADQERTDGAAPESDNGPVRKKQRRGRDHAEKNGDGAQTSSSNADSNAASGSSIAAKQRRTTKKDAQVLNQGKSTSAPIVSRADPGGEQPDGSDSKGRTHRGSRGSRKKPKAAEIQGDDDHPVQSSKGSATAGSMLTNPAGPKSESISKHHSKGPAGAAAAKKDEDASLADDSSAAQQPKKPKKLRQRQAKKLAQDGGSAANQGRSPPLAWDALPDQAQHAAAAAAAKTDDVQPIDGSSKPNLDQANASKARTSIVGIVEVKKNKRADRGRAGAAAAAAAAQTQETTQAGPPFPVGSRTGSTAADKASAGFGVGGGGGDESGWGTGGANGGGDFWG